MRYLAIDHGLKRTGMAICDPQETIASPLQVIQTNNSQQLIQKIQQLINEHNIEAVVMGLPLNDDGSQGQQAKLVLRFTDRLKKHIQIPIHFQNEYLSTFQAKEKIQDAELTLKEKKKRLDAIAAAQILEDFLQQKNDK